MSRLAVPLALAAAAPAVAQDMPGAVDLGAQARVQVQSSTAEGYAERGGARRADEAPLSARSRGYCDAFPAYRSRYGAGDPRVVKLAAACRRAGYRY